MFVKFTDADTNEPIYVNLASVRLVRTADPLSERQRGTVRIQFDDEHVVTVSERLAEVLKALGVR